MTGSIDLNPNHLATVERILAEHAPECEVRAFGSRAAWTAKDYSDLDLAIVGTGPLDRRTLGRLKEAFEESRLPMRVDVLDWHAISQSFREVIERDYVVVQEGANWTAGSGWTKVALGEVALVRSGFAFKGSDWTSEGVPVVKIANVRDGNLAMGGCSFVSKVTADRAADFSLRIDDILIAMTGYIGDVAIVRSHNLPAVLNQRVGQFTIRDPDVLLQRFLFYLLRSEGIRREIEGFGYGSAQPNISPTLIHSVEIPLPPLPEQRAIAHVLGTLDDKIDLNRRMNETLEEMARALFKSWFVDFEPVRAKMEGRDTGLPPEVAALFPDRLVDSELGEIPEGWGVKVLGEIVEQLRDSVNPLTSPMDLFSHFSIPAYDQGQTPSPELGGDIKSTKSRVPPRTVLLSKLNPEIERVWLVDVVPDERAICSTEFLVLRPRSPFQNSYIYCLVRSAPFRQQLESLVTGTSKSHQRAQADAIMKLQVVCPGSPIVHTFKSMAQGFLRYSLACRRESRTLAAQRDALLPRLVSGEVRLYHDEHQTEFN